MSTPRDDEHLEAILDLAAPEGWRRSDPPNGIGYAPREVLESVDGDIRYATLSAVVLAVPRSPDGSVDDPVEHLMARRVLQGEPGRFSAELDGVPARGFEWTDGICDILSYFAQSPRGDLVELIVACDLRAPGAPAAIADVARMILSRFRWKR